MYVDGVQDAALRSQLASFLSSLRLTAPAKEVDGEKTPQAFRCSRGGGGVLRCVASLMDERGMVHPPPLDREAAFEAAKKASRKHLLIFRDPVLCVCSVPGLYTWYRRNTVQGIHTYWYNVIGVLIACIALRQTLVFTPGMPYHVTFGSISVVGEQLKTHLSLI